MKNLRLIITLFALLLSEAIVAQFGSISVLTREGENVLIPICNIAYVYETPDGAELITDGFNSGRDNQENRLLLALTYDAVINMACDYIKPCEFIERPTGFRTAVSMCYVENIFENGGLVQAKGKDGRRLRMLDPYIDIVQDMLCIQADTVGTDRYLVNAELTGTILQLVMNTGTSWSVDLTAAFTDNDVKLESGFVNGDCEMILNMSDGSTVTVPLGNCAGNPDDIGTDDQKIDLFQVSGNQLCISLEDDGEPVKCVDISSLNPDDQFVDILNFDGQQLCISLVDDGIPPVCVDLSSLEVGGINDFTLDCNTGILLLDMVDQADFPVDLNCLLSDDQNIVQFYFDPNGNQVCIELEDGNGLQCATLTGIGSDDQIADQFQLIDDVLYLSLEDDGQAPYTVDLSFLGSNDPNTDDQVVQVFSFDPNTNLLTIQIEDDITGPQIVDLSALINNGTDTDDQCGVLSIDGNELTLTIDDCPTPSTVDLGTIITDDQQLNSAINCTSGILSLTLEDNPAGVVEVDLSCLVGGGGNDDQMVDLFSFDCNSKELSISLEDDGVGPYIVDLTCIGGSGNVDLEYVVNCENQTLTLDIPDDPDGPEIIDLSCLVGNYIWRIGSDTPNDYDIEANDLVEFKTTDPVLSSTVLNGGQTKTVYYSFINGDPNQVLTLDAGGQNPSWQDPVGSIPVCDVEPVEGQILVWDDINEWYCPEDVSTSANARNGLSVVPDGGIDYVELGGTLYKNTTVLGQNTHIMNFFNCLDFIVDGGAWTLQTGGQGILQADTEMWMQLPNYTTTPIGSIVQKQENTFGTVLYTPYGFPTTTGSDGDFLVYNDVTNQLEFQPSTNGLISFDVTGDVGTQTVTTGDVLNFSGSNLIATAVTATDNVDIFIDGTGASVNQVISWNGTTAVWTTLASSYTFTIDGDDAQTEVINSGDVLLFDGIGVVDANIESPDAVEISILPGGNDQVLTTVAGVVQWADAASGAGDDWGAGNFTARADGAQIETVDEGDQLRFVGDGIIATSIASVGTVNTVDIEIPAGADGTVLTSNAGVVTWSAGGGAGDDWGAGNFLVNDGDGTDQVVAEGTTLRILGTGVLNFNNEFSAGDNEFTGNIVPGDPNQVLTTVGGTVQWADAFADDWGNGFFQIEGDISVPGQVDEGEKLAFKTATGGALEFDYVATTASTHLVTLDFVGGTTGQVLTVIGPGNYNWSDPNNYSWVLDADAGTSDIIEDGFTVNFASNDPVFTTSVISAGMGTTASIEFEFIDGIDGQVLTFNGSTLTPEWADAPSGGGSTTASNGLNKVGDDIRLGGSLSQATTINGLTHQFTVNRSSGNLLDLRDNFTELFYNGAGMIASTNSAQLRSASGSASSITVNSTQASINQATQGNVFNANGTSTSVFGPSSTAVQLNTSGITLENGTTIVDIGSGDVNIQTGSGQTAAEFLTSETRIKQSTATTLSGLRLTSSQSILSSPDATTQIAVQNGNIFIGNIPTSDPGVPGRIWNDNGDLKISI